MRREIVINIQANKLKKFFLGILSHLNVDKNVAYHLIEGLIQTSLRGVDSHGIRLFPHYIRALEAGRINGSPNYKFEKTSLSTGKLDADHTFGHAAGAEGMQRAIKLAKEAGIGSVAVYNSSHFGAAAYYALMAAKRDMIGLSFTHADALVVPSRGKRPYFGTNPICFAAPCDGEEPYCLDMATSFYNWNKVKQLREGRNKAPLGIGVDKKGNETTDPQKMKALIPIGDYKGYGLGMMIDILCSLLTGMPFGPHISSMFESPVNEHRFLGHYFMAIRIDCFENPKTFKARLAKMMREVRSEPRYKEDKPILVAGDPEKNNYKNRVKKGIPIRQKDFESLVELGQKYEITTLEKINKGSK